MIKKILSIALPFIVFAFISPDAEAIPAFARKYRISCQTCHTPSSPKLKAYGDDFAGDGFRLTDYEAPRYYVETGDPELSLIRELPMAVRLDGFVTYNFSDNNKTDFGAPYALKLMTGGALSDRLSYYFYFFFSEQGEVAGIEDAFLMYNNLFDQDLDIYLGQFQVSDPLFKRELRLSLEDYHVYTSQIGISDINMTYDKGLMVTYGLPSGTTVTMELVNGNGISEANRWKVFDKDKYKNILVHVSQDIGDFFRIGALGYYGNEELINNENYQLKNTVLFGGVDATASINEKFEMNLQYLYRSDSELYPNLSSFSPIEDIATNGFMAELIYSPKGDDSKWYWLGLLNYVESDFTPANYRSATAHCGYMLRRNIRLAAEYTYVFTNTEEQFGRASVGFVSAF